MKSLALALLALLPLAGCAAPLGSPIARCQTAGGPGLPAYQACMQGEYARQMRQMDHQAYLELTKGQMGTR